ncbi:MAG: type II toxin-antitoxin system death-on-curing family toxin [bacterium]
MYNSRSDPRLPGLLESAVAAPQSAFGGEWLHDGLFEMAAAYAFHIAENQPFIDGNKRTGLLCAVVFLDINGISIDYPDDRLYQAMLDIAEKKMDKKSFADLLHDISNRK